MSKHFADLAGPVTPAEAHEALVRFCNSHFNNPKEHARVSIPADPRRDDDIRLGAFIEHVEQLIAAADDMLEGDPEGYTSFAYLRAALANLKAAPQ